MKLVVEGIGRLDEATRTHLLSVAREGAQDVLAAYLQSVDVSADGSRTTVPMPDRP